MKQQTIPSPITDENFSEVWNYANNKFMELKKKKLIRTIIIPVENIVFWVCATITTLHFLIHTNMAAINKCLETLGSIKNLGTIADPIIYHPELHIILQIILYLIFLLGTPFLISALVALIVGRLYRPAVSNTETGNKATDSQTLVDALQEIQIRTKRVEGISSIASVGLYALETMSLTVLFFISIATTPELLTNDSAAEPLLKLLASFPSLINLLPVIYMSIYVIYVVLSEYISKFLSPFYKTKLASNIQEDAKNYYYECNTEAKKAYEEEEIILQRAIEIKRKRKKEEEELLAKINYRNPVYKYIKIGIITLILIVTFIFAGNKLKSIDFEKLFNALGSESVEESTESTENVAEPEDDPE